MFVTVTVKDLVLEVPDGFKTMPKPPAHIDVDLPDVVAYRLVRDTPSVGDVHTLRECLRFTLGLHGYSYCNIITYGSIIPKEGI